MRRFILGLAFMGSLASTAAAGGFWLPATDQRLRDDLTLLVDEGIIQLPVTAWPLPVHDVRRVIGRPKLADIAEPALQAALLRVRAAVHPDAQPGDFRISDVAVTAGQSGLLRHYGTLGRDDLQLQAVGGVSTEDWSANVSVTAVASPDDDQSLRLDGTDFTLRWGNWLFSANQMERWWGPGQFGSLILSTNARPMPQLSIDRVESTPFSFPVLRLFGPWRFSAFVGALEGERKDVDHPLFMGMRLSFQPVPIMEVGLSRTAQFCGQNPQRTRVSCDLEQVGRVLVGQDNNGFRGVVSENEPGNQMAGVDIRITSPFKPLPAAIYGQLIGEDSSNQSQSVVPNRFLGLFGAEGWAYLDSGAVLRGQLEYANTSCKWYAPTRNPDCGYRQAVFFAGYRYRDRNIGHPTDSDSESVGLRLQLQLAKGDRFSARLYRAKLDRLGAADIYNPVTLGKSEYESAEIGWDGQVTKDLVSVQLGYERQDGGASSRSGLFGFVKWRRSL